LQQDNAGKDISDKENQSKHKQIGRILKENLDLTRFSCLNSI